MPSPPRPWAEGRGRSPTPRLSDNGLVRPFRDIPANEDEDDDFDHDSRHRKRRKVESSASRLAPQAPRRWRLLGSLSGLSVLVAVALLATFRSSPARVANLLDFSRPPVPSEDTQYSGLATAWHPLPTSPATAEIRKAIVMASYKSQDVEWLKDLPKYTKGWEIFRYVGDDPDTDSLALPSANGREAMAFLTFIIENYNYLPDYTVFTHGHDRAWHQPQRSIDNLMALNLTAVAAENYVNLRCPQSPGCTADTKFYFDPRNEEDHRPGMIIEQGFWEHMMADEFGPLPAVFGRRCCAQFAVTKRAIHLRSLDFWKSLRQPLEGQIKDMKNQWGPKVDKYRLGSLYEQIWHILFGKDPDFCPTKEYCQRVHFSGYIHCDGETTSYRENKDNWDQITCTNELRDAIDSGTPLDSIFPDASVGPPPGITAQKKAAEDDVLSTKHEALPPSIP